MPTLILVRHGRTKANADGVLAGRSPGVRLDQVGRKQAAEVAARLAPVPLATLVTSPLARTVATAQAIIDAQQQPPPLLRAKGIIECGYGDWTGQSIKALAKHPMWKTVQNQPSAAVFPGGESLLDMQHRAVSTVRAIDAEVEGEHGEACWVAVSHGDVIKAILADALGMHLDAFQRLVVHPASVSVVRYTATRPMVLYVNDGGSDLSALRASPKRRRRGKPSGDAVVGGGDGSL
ncbi:MAG: MSMEG_4193 family putative phosphomutase [Nocardioidaceae bacterium]